MAALPVTIAQVESTVTRAIKSMHRVARYAREDTFAAQGAKATHVQLANMVTRPRRQLLLAARLVRTDTIVPVQQLGLLAVLVNTAIRPH